MSDVLIEREKKRTVGNEVMAAYHDNAPAHNALGIREFLAKNNIAVLEQPPTQPLSSSGLLRLLFVSQTQGSHQRSSFLRLRSH